jgi:hypothetical protein
MILSDIDVHREQTGGAARYFGADDAEALANLLSDGLQDGKPVVARVTYCRISMSVLAHLRRALQI